MTEPRLLPGDPSELHLRICYADDLWDTPQADTLERWDVAILHRRRTHSGATTPGAGTCVPMDCPACTVEDVGIGSMTFYRVHLDRGRNAYWAMEEESEDLFEIAQVLLDPETGSFTGEVSALLEYVGSALLVMDRVTLDQQWRGHGLASILAIEVIHRLMAGCRAITRSLGERLWCEASRWGFMQLSAGFVEASRCNRCGGIASSGEAPAAPGPRGFRRVSRRGRSLPRRSPGRWWVRV
ncbi:hypothetical protein ACFV23_02805 [Streptomyces sp. NPDC059627]